MYKGQRILAVVPARGGSLGITRKNIVPLGGRPLIHHTLEQIREVEELDLAVVSTDDDEIAAIAIEGGGQVIMRPAELSISTSKTEEALLHALEHLSVEGQVQFDYICVLEPTSPFRSAATIGACLRALIDSDAKSLMTVVETRANIGQLKNEYFRPLRPGAPRRRQDRQPYYVESSTVYVCRSEFLQQTGSLVCDDWLAIEVSANEAIDINEPIDLIVAEAIISKQDQVK